MKKGGSRWVRHSVIAIVLAVIVSLSAVLAVHTIRTSANGTTLSVAEGVRNIYNMSVNNSDANQAGNITQVNITLPAGFNFTAASANTSGNANHFFTNTSTVLSWTNETFYLINGSGGDNQTYFWFNATVNSPGTYTIVVRTVNGTSTFNTGNITVNVNDTRNPAGFYVFPANATNTSSSTINISGNFTDNYNLSALTLYVWNSSNALVNSTIVNTSLTSLLNGIANFTYTFPRDDRYFFNFLMNDTANNSVFNNTNFTILYDATRPLAVFNDSGAGATSGNYANVSRNWIFVNATITETNEANVTFTLYNGTGSSVNVTTFTSAQRTINWTGLSNGNYTYNVSVTDYANNRNTTATRTIILDTAGPSVTLSKSSSTKTSLTISITASDATSNVNGSCSVSGRPNAVVSGASSITESGLSCSTSYAYDVACNDYAGNSGATSASFSTDSCGGGGTAGGGGGGTTTAAWSSTFVPEASIIAQGFTRSLAAKERVKVVVANKEHHVGVLEVTNTSVKVQITSTPQNATLTIGETKKFEVTNDSIYDLAVTLHGISGNKANVTITTIAEKMPEIPPSTGAAVQESTNVTRQEQPAASPKAERESISPRKLWTTIIIVVIIIIVIVWIVKTRRRS